MISILVELCAGTGALSLALQAEARPPVSRMGCKQGYTHAILSALGLRAGEGAGAYVWVEPDAGMASLLRCYPDSDALRRIAEQIRGWSSEEPRALWERLRAEGKAQAGEDPGAWLWMSARSYGNEIKKGFIPPEKVKGPNSHGGVWLYQPDTPALVIDSLSILHWPPVRVIHGRAEDVTVREVAGWLYVARKTAFSRDPYKSHDGGGPSSFDVLNGDGQGKSFAPTIRCLEGIGRVDWPPVSVLHDRAESVEVEKVPEGAVVYLDPPYQATTDYASDLPREAVLDLAQRWHAAGATVAISEQVPLPIDGWHHLRIDQYRVGQKRIFSRQQEEWITMSRPPVPPALWMQRRTDPGQMGLWEERA